MCVCVCMCVPVYQRRSLALCGATRRERVGQKSAGPSATSRTRCTKRPGWGNMVFLIILNETVGIRVYLLYFTIHYLLYCFSEQDSKHLFLQTRMTWHQAAFQPHTAEQSHWELPRASSSVGLWTAPVKQLGVACLALGQVSVSCKFVHSDFPSRFGFEPSTFSGHRWISGVFKVIFFSYTEPCQVIYLVWWWWQSWLYISGKIVLVKEKYICHGYLPTWFGSHSIAVKWHTVL